MDMFIVNGSGILPSIPGQYSNCKVVRGDDGLITVTPLPNHHERMLDEIATQSNDPPLVVIPPYQLEEPPLLEESPTIPLKPREGGE